MSPITDANIRAQAINPKASYLVQAPAGSGKTELLIQRILALLATVHEPEEVLALTFTRKAAAEMRERVIQALHAAKQAEPNEPHAKTTWKLAHQALKRSEKLDWKLTEYPARLRMMTLDAFASGLARQLPILSGFGQTPATADFAEPIYQQAVDDLLDYSKQKQAPQALSQAINTLILHQDCKIAKLRNLLASMLSRREQWLPDVLRYSPDMPSFRQHLEASLATIINHTLEQAEQHFSPEQKSEIMRLGHFAASQLCSGPDSDEHVFTPFLHHHQFPSADIEHLSLWNAITHLLLTGKGELRKAKGINIRLGFGASDEAKPFKEALITLLASLEGDGQIAEHLKQVRKLPDSHQFDDIRWHTLQAMFTTLKMLAGQLWQSFEQHKQVDFVEIMLRAKQALGQNDESGSILPSEALLRLDHQIQHILIDEFQDTSTLQIDLLSRLTAGWSGDDGRTLFVVGDPMQSIYRFRKAEVSLFLQAAKNALPPAQHIPPVTALKLSQNFRSSPSIIDWVNQAFTHILPAQDDVLSGAIAYTPSHAFKQDKGLVTLNILSEKSAQQEADLIMDIIREKRAQGKSVGVLARSRSHLKVLMQTLQQQDIAFRALDILPLHQQTEIIDLLSLTSALLRPADHIAWASVLRSPMLGLSTTSLLNIFQAKPLSAWQAIKGYAQASNDADEKQRLHAFIAAIEPALCATRRIPLRKLVESVWLRLYAPATLSKTQLTNADVFFDLLSNLDDGAQLDMALLQQRLQKLYGKPESKPNADQVELLTMHGAKGLQWDTVILCGLGKTPRAKDKEVLVQTEVSTHQGQQFLLSPLPQHGHDAMYDLIRDFEKQRDALEVARLLYVACTRAEQELHMFGEVRGSQQASASLLALLWQDEGECFGADIRIHEGYDTIQQDKQVKTVPQRLSASFQAPSPYAPIPSQQNFDEQLSAHIKPEFNWAGAQAKAVGIAVHAALQYIAERGLSQWQKPDDAAVTQLMRQSLQQHGISSVYLDKALYRCQKGMADCFNSTRLRWILDELHAEQHNEWALTYQDAGVCKHMVLDRSFVDADGVRWVVDYKTGTHLEDDVEAWLDQELKRYTIDTPQLPNYVQVLQALEPERTIKAALYFPMMDAWREWESVLS